MSGLISLRSAVSPPKYCPSAATRGVPDPPVVPSEKIEVSAGGASGAKRCQAASASSACDHGHDTLNHDAPAARCVLTVSAVTMPKFPPPPPRQAQ